MPAMGSQGWLPGAEECRYRELSEQIPAVLYSEVHTPRGALIYKSPQNQQLLGYTGEETMQPDFWKSVLHPDDRERILAENERCDRTGDPWHVEYRILHKDGRVVWLRHHAVRVRGRHGEPAGHGHRHRPHPPAGRVEPGPGGRRRPGRPAGRQRRPAHHPDTPVWVKLARRSEGVLLAVEDAGVGVPRELQATLFEPFRQGPGTSSHAPGVGIGLSLVARFAELHGGRAWVQDRPGGGASFQVLLPDLGDGDGGRN